MMIGGQSPLSPDPRMHWPRLDVTPWLSATKPDHGEGALPIKFLIAYGAVSADTKPVNLQPAEFRWALYRVRTSAVARQLSG